MKYVISWIEIKHFQLGLGTMIFSALFLIQKQEDILCQHNFCQQKWLLPFVCLCSSYRFIDYKTFIKRIASNKKIFIIKITWCIDRISLWCQLKRIMLETDDEFSILKSKLKWNGMKIILSSNFSALTYRDI